ncbi:hypothetical protein F4775DRAFT_568893 [Biscogniauxia sp. FL1348]|nr:hypothetical protein F4775DRAFT_568893 [Biscogniauxia sp. FL1348]
MPQLSSDPYTLLGVSPHASISEIRRAFHSLSLAHHPDKTGDSPEATARFQLILSAYKTLSEKSQRQREEHRYDNHGSRLRAAAGHRNQTPQKRNTRDERYKNKNKKKSNPKRASVLAAFAHCLARRHRTHPPYHLSHRSTLIVVLHYLNQARGELLPGVEELVLAVSARPARISSSSSSSPAAQGAAQSIRRKTAEFKSAVDEFVQRLTILRNASAYPGWDELFEIADTAKGFARRLARERPLGRQMRKIGERMESFGALIYDDQRDLVVQFAEVLNLWP